MSSVAVEYSSASGCYCCGSCYRGESVAETAMPAMVVVSSELFAVGLTAVIKTCHQVVPSFYFDPLRHDLDSLRHGCHVMDIID